jgi:hypothetical protein
MVKKVIASALLAASMAFADDSSSSQAKALELYPALGHADSALNKLFVARVQALRSAADPLMQRPDWPLVIATQVAKEIGIPPIARNSPPVASPNTPAEAPAVVSRPQSGKAVGIVTQFDPNSKKGEPSLMFKSEGAKQAARYLLAAPGSGVDPKLQPALKSVFPTNLVTLEWNAQDPPVVTGIRVMLPSARTGVLTGIVTERLSQGKDVYIDIKPDGQPTERYMPNWVDGGWNKEVCAGIAATNIGDKVKLRWYYDERRRVVELSVISKALAPRVQ